ncbi:hypothetical protein MLD38_037973 [Melastoma candidum]|uniref:Uncharacterized protein n=1 Tax=Melastoma candidum TaxID=119954 RepID=A0ACB9KY19_9MYRT|nr:hypothetical protein MLD38_037973 [Melastoma candidum]
MAFVLRSFVTFAAAVALFSCALLARAHVVPALYVFGDSTIDAGNNNFLNTLAKTNFTPYGIDLCGKLPLGRATNGLTYADFIAEHLGLPPPPPYLSFNDAKSRSKVTTGMNYASSSSGILNHTGSRAGKCLPLSEQVGYFKKTVRHDLPRQIPLRGELKLHLKKSIILISIAGNDYTLGYLMDEEMRKKHDVVSYTKLLVHYLAANVERMAKLGAKKFVVRGMPMISCRSPFFKVIEQQCDELGKEIIPLYNAQLIKSLDRLKAKHGILYTIIVPEKIEISAAAAEIGSKFTYEPCCKINEFGGCIKDSEPCKNRDDYLHFDAAHLTQVYHKFVADRCFDGISRTCQPYCILELSAK